MIKETKQNNKYKQRNKNEIKKKLQNPSQILSSTVFSFNFYKKNLFL